MPAHAVGRLADINLIDRDSGAVPARLSPPGRALGGGRPGARYAVSVRNATGARVLSVISVDGVNVVSGETASWEQTGYVLAPWQATDITGWRKSDAEVAAFHFTASSASYASRTGRPDHVGRHRHCRVPRRSFRPPPPVAVPYSLPRAHAGVPRIAASARRQHESAGAATPKTSAQSPAPGDADARAESRKDARQRAQPRRQACIGQSGACGCCTPARHRPRRARELRVVSPHGVRAPQPTGPTS
jgi:hypothetical protein